MRKYVSIAGIVFAVIAIILRLTGFATTAEPFFTDGGVILIGVGSLITVAP